MRRPAVRPLLPSVDPGRQSSSVISGHGAKETGAGPTSGSSNIAVVWQDRPNGSVHLVDLGVTVVWLMPSYPTADVDDGYDITDFYTVDPRQGSLGEFVEFDRTATARGLKVIADLVVNHTSADHPWFRPRDPAGTHRCVTGLENH